MTRTAGRRRAPTRRSLSALAPLLLLAAGSGLAPAAARADCAPDPANPNDTVTCDDDADGFIAGVGVEPLAVVVQPGATVGNADVAGNPAIGVNDDSTVDHQGDIVANGAGSSGIHSGDRNGVTTAIPSNIDVTGAGSVGISMGSGTPRALALDPSDATLAAAGSITAAGDGAIGISVGDDVLVDHDLDISDMNTATLTVSGGNNVGILGGDRTGVDNRGTITLMDANSAGIRLGDEAQVRNFGLIDVQGDDSVGVEMGLGNPLFLTEFNNALFGVVNVAGDNSTGVSVGLGSRVTNGAGATITVSGSGSRGIVTAPLTDPDTESPVFVNNFGTIEVGGAGATGLVMGDTSTIQLGALGLVDVTGPGAVGIELLNSLPDSDTATLAALFGAIDAGPGTTAISTSSATGWSGLTVNLGASINAAAADFAYRGGDGIDVLLNVGMVDGVVDLGGGDDSVAVGPAGVFTMGVAGGAGADTFTLTGSADAAAPGFDLSGLSDFESLDAAAFFSVWQLSGSASFSSGVNVLAGSTLGLDGIVGITGDYSQQTGSGLEVSVNPDGTGDRLDITGLATLESGTTLVVDPTGALTPGSTFTVLTATGGVSGSFDMVTSTSPSFTSFTAVSNPNDVTVLFRRNSFASAALTPNQRAVALALDPIANRVPGGDMGTLIARFDSIGASYFPRGADELSPEAYDAQTSVNLAVGRRFAKLLQSRPLHCESETYAPLEVHSLPPCSERRVSPWGSLVGEVHERSGGSKHLGYGADSGGVAIGVDARPADGWLLSALFGGNSGNLTVDDDFGGGNFSSLEIGAAVTALLDQTHVRAVVEYGHAWHSTGRTMWALQRAARGRYQSDRITAVAEVGHALRFGLLEVEPIGSLDYTHLIENGVTEQGAGSASLVIPGRSHDVLSTTTGVRLAATLFKYAYLGSSLEWADGVWRPEVDVRWREFWTGARRSVDARLVGAPAGTGRFAVDAADAERGVEIAARLSFQPLRSRVTIGVGYEAFLGDGTTAHRFDAKLRVPLP